LDGNTGSLACHVTRKMISTKRPLRGISV